MTVQVRRLRLHCCSRLGDSDTKVENQNVKTPNMASDETAEKEGVAESARQRPADIETEKATRPAEETPAPTGVSVASFFPHKTSVSFLPHNPSSRGRTHPKKLSGVTISGWGGGQGPLFKDTNAGIVYPV